jgi:hypothetical protein
MIASVVTTHRLSSLLPWLFCCAAMISSSCKGQRTIAGPPVADRVRMVEKTKTPGTNSNSLSAVGTVLDSIEDWSPEWAFVDAFKSSRPWISGTATTFDDGRAIEVDEHGWVKRLGPGQWARTLLFWDQRSHPGGRYRITWEGKGVVAIEHQAVMATEGAGNVIMVEVDPNQGGFQIVIRETDPTNPVRNLHAWLPGGACQAEVMRSCTVDADCGGSSCAMFAGGTPVSPFHPVFLQRLAPYKVLRFMNWQRTNNSPMTTAKQLPSLQDARWSTSMGAPIELMMQLANTLHADPWINVPHQADDALMMRMAQVARQSLDKDRVLYVEYSNEVWNGMFTQSVDVGQRGRGLRRDAYAGLLAAAAERASAVFRAFEPAFGADHLVRVVGSQAANAWTSDELLSSPPLQGHVDALAIAPYFGISLGEAAKTSAVTDLDALFTILHRDALPEATAWMVAQQKVATKHGVEMIAYEGGQHLVGVGPVVDDARINALFDAAQRDPRMAGLYDSYLNAWQQSGGHLFVHFTSTSAWSKWGRWGAAPTQTEPLQGAPKLSSLIRFVQQHPRWW